MIGYARTHFWHIILWTRKPLRAGKENHVSWARGKWFLWKAWFFVLSISAEIHPVGVSTLWITPMLDSWSNSFLSVCFRAIGTLFVDSSQTECTIPFFLLLRKHLCTAIGNPPLHKNCTLPCWSQRSDLSNEMIHPFPHRELELHWSTVWVNIGQI